MEVKQIASMLNDIYSETIGEGEPFAEDLSNIVSLGQTITGSSTFGKNFDNAFASVVDKVGLTLWGTKGYANRGLGLVRYGVEFASVIEKLRVDVGEYEDNQAWKLTGEDAETLDFSDIWDYVPATVSATYYNKAVTFKVKISVADYQFKSAFRSAADMVKLVNMIEMRIQMKLGMAMDALEKRVVANLVGEKCLVTNHPNVINLLALYKSEVAGASSTLTADKAMSDPEFLRFASMKMGVYRDLLAEDTNMFNETDYVTHTLPSELKFLLNSDFAKALSSNLYADTYNEEYVKLDGYRTVGFWQAMGSKADRATIKVKPASNNGKVVTATYVMGVMFDKDAAFIAGEQPVSKALPNPDGDFTNFWHKMKASYYNDLAENCVVFVLADPTVANATT